MSNGYIKRWWNAPQKVAKRYEYLTAVKVSKIFWVVTPRGSLLYDAVSVTRLDSVDYGGYKLMLMNTRGKTSIP